jgi:hypothetical protein
MTAPVKVSDAGPMSDGAAGSEGGVRNPSQMQLIAAHVLEGRDRPRNAAKFLALCTSSCWVFGANLRIVMSSILERKDAEHGVWQSNANVLTSMEPPYDPAMGTYQLRALLCRIAKDGAPHARPRARSRFSGRSRPGRRHQQQNGLSRQTSLKGVGRHSRATHKTAEVSRLDQIPPRQA